LVAVLPVSSLASDPRAPRYIFVNGDGYISQPRR